MDKLSAEDYERNTCWCCGGPLPVVRPDEEHCSQVCKDKTSQAADEAAEALYG